MRLGVTKSSNGKRRRKQVVMVRKLKSADAGVSLFEFETGAQMIMEMKSFG